MNAMVCLVAMVICDRDGDCLSVVGRRLRCWRWRVQRSGGSSQCR